MGLRLYSPTSLRKSKRHKTIYSNTVFISTLHFYHLTTDMAELQNST